MQIYHAMPTDKARRVVTIGNFDGVHRGHQALLEKTVQAAQRVQAAATVLTFSNHPLAYKTGKELKYLTTRRQQARLLDQIGIDQLVSIPFDDAMLGMPTDLFVQDYLVQKLHAQELVLGFDSRFGPGEQGEISYIQKSAARSQIHLHIIEPVLYQGERISSTLIRHSIQQGQVEKARDCLGRPYQLEGTVVHGRKIGRALLGYPTANLQVEGHLVIPAEAVYHCQALLRDGRCYEAAVSVGNNPTVNGRHLTVEAFLLDFDELIYDQSLRLDFKHYLRPQQRFEDLQALISQMDEDVSRIRRGFT